MPLARRSDSLEDLRASPSPPAPSLPPFSFPAEASTPRGDALPSPSSSSSLPSAPLPDLSAASSFFLPQLIPLSYAQLRRDLDYLPEAARRRIDEALHFAAWAHEGQTRATGEPYITHPIAVARIVAQWKLDDNGLMAALLHDVLEDCGISKQELQRRFGATVADLVDALTKLERLEHQSVEEAQAANFRKMFLAMARDLRVILIKLADRLHNMRTLSALKPHKRKRIARETLELYAPIALRLGLNALYRELQDLSLAAEHPWRHSVLAAALETARGANAELLDRFQRAVADALREWGISAQLSRREKHLYSIYQKMRQKRARFSQILDLFGLRVITSDTPSVYLALGAIHRRFKPIPGKIKDYIALPKANGYQSLHTTVIGPDGIPVEIQIRTQEQHRHAEQGIAAHWRYKAETPLAAETHAWLQNLLELQQETEARDFLEAVKIDLYPNEVFVFTPKGDIVALPRGATAVDFAYAIHSHIGHAAIACRVNGDLMPLRTELQNGDRVEIITSATPTPIPNPAWLNFVKTARARAAIRRTLRRTTEEHAVALGERLLDQALRPYGLSLGDISTPTWVRLLKQTNHRDKKPLFLDIGLGQKNPLHIAELLVAAQDQETGRGPLLKPHPLQRLKVGEGNDATLTYALCCRPVPGDPILGLLRKGRGLDIHRLDCPIALKTSKGRWIELDWSEAIPPERRFSATLTVLAQDCIGLLARLTAALAQEHTNITGVILDPQPDAMMQIHFTLDVRDTLHLQRLTERLRRLEGVTRVDRPLTAR
ncbi:MAG: bifunctional (p)ppGpp synthetase/guanosine-3',5'-bis(diphosphate) 3'-pyrophosphohydrolase [Hydrogenophilus sp.]|nr:bifunctional (p)ppGpp synthetase/guanosine-3',5'-bis(diphosphate) 3'-pyrophosphohydrolase [Hydrogenophilus sp.]